MPLKTLVIIPAYNEEDCILKTVNEVISYGYDYVVINDGSKDNTLQLCHDHNINVIDLPNNLGIGGAIQTGHKYAMQHGYDVDIQFDGDGQHDAAYIPELLNQIEAGADLAIGSRFIDAKGEGFQSTFMRRVGINWLSGLIKVFTRKRVTDPTSGFRATGGKALKLFCETYPIDYPEPESITLAIKQGLSVQECSVQMRERAGGTSSIRPLSSIYYMIKVSLAIIIVGSTGKVR